MDTAGSMALMDAMEAKLRFVMIVSGYPPMKTAGMERGCERLAVALARRGHKVSVITQAARDLLPRETTATGVTVYRVIKPIALGPLWGVTYMAQVRRWLKRLAADYDFCLCHKLDLHSPVANSVCRKFGKASAHLLVNAGEFSDLGRLRSHKGGARLLEKALAANGFFALSRSSTEELLNAKVPRERILPYRYFVDTEAFAPDSEVAPEGFLFLGRFHEQKNIPLLLKAFTRLHRETPEMRLALVGDGPEAAKIKQLVENSSAKSSIVMHPWAKNPVAAYRRAAAVVLPSRSEGLSNVMIEAMACGTPVIATDVSGAREALDPANQAPVKIGPGKLFHGSGGIIVPPGDEEALLAAMKEVVHDPKLRSRMGLEARRNAVERFSEKPAVEMFLEGAELIYELHNENGTR